MKKRIMTVMIVAVLVVSALALVACGGNNDVNAKMEIKEAKSQIDALMEVKALTSDAAIIDATMAGYLLKSDGSFSNLRIVELDGVEFEKEYYAVAAKKGNDKLMAFVNAGMKKAQESGKYDELLKKYGLELRSNKITDTFEVPEDWKSTLKDNKVVIGYTANAPMGVVEADGKVTGFDIELAEEVFKDTGIEIVPQLIEWDNKETLLKSNTIDLVWNGLTSTPQRQEEMCLSAFYMDNAQAIVVNAKFVDDFKSIDSLKGMKVIVEAGSAGAENAKIIADKINK